MKKFILLWSVISIVACSSESFDQIVPVFLSVEIQGESESPIYVAAETSLDIVANVHDNEGLNQVKIDLHNAFDGHGHGKMGFTPWTYVNIIDVSGTQDVAIDSVIIPVDATAGLYHVVFRVLDRSGNEGEFEELAIIITNGSEPQVNVVSPDFSLNPVYSKGDSLTFMGSISDSDGLTEVHVLLREKLRMDEYRIWDEMEFDLQNLGLTQFDLNQVQLHIPTSISAGEYQIAFVSLDALGNQGIYYGHLRVE